MRLSEEIEVDDVADVVTICGVKYAGGVFRGLGIQTPPGQLFRIEARTDGVLTLTNVPDNRRES